MVAVGQSASNVNGGRGGTEDVCTLPRDIPAAKEVGHLADVAAVGNNVNAVELEDGVEDDTDGLSDDSGGSLGGGV